MNRANRNRRLAHREDEPTRRSAATGMRRTGRSVLSSQHSRPAFTLVELMVSVAILLAVLGMIGMVFQTAGKSSGIAQASTILYRQLSDATETIRRDLDGLRDNPDAVLAIAGVQVKAYETQKDRESGRTLDTATDLNLNKDAHRADVLMLMTNRPFSPCKFEQPPAGGTVPAITFSAITQVVYGHADFGPQVKNTTNVQRVEGTATQGTSDMSASQWHLARRRLGFPAGSLKSNQQQLDGVYPHSGTNFVLTDAEFLLGLADVAGAFPNPGDFDIGFLHFRADATKHAYCVTCYGYTYLWDATTWYVLYGGHWYARVSATTWRRSASSTNYDISGLPDPVTLNLRPLVTPYAQDWFYDSSKTDRRTRLDVSGTTDASQLGAYFLPGCSEFKVEFTYDDPREVDKTANPPKVDTVVNPGPDPDPNWDMDDEPVTNPILAPKPIRWQTVPNGEQMVWSGLSVNPKNSTDPFRRPRALRITIRAWGKGGALDQPIEQTVMYAFR